MEKKVLKENLHTELEQKLSVLWSSTYEAGRARGFQNSLRQVMMFNKKNDENVKKLYQESMTNLTGVTKIMNNMIDPRDITIRKLRLELNPNDKNPVRESEVSANEDLQKKLLTVVTSFYMEGVACGSIDFCIKEGKPYLEESKERLKMLRERRENLKLFSNTFYALLQTKDKTITKLNERLITR